MCISFSVKPGCCWFRFLAPLCPWHRLILLHNLLGHSHNWKLFPCLCCPWEVSLRLLCFINYWLSFFVLTFCLDELSVCSMSCSEWCSVSMYWHGVDRAHPSKVEGVLCPCVHVCICLYQKWVQIRVMPVIWLLGFVMPILWNKLNQNIFFWCNRSINAW